MDKNIKPEIQNAIRRDEAIEMDGFKFYPIRVHELPALEAVAPAVEFLQQSFPVRYAVMPLLSAFYAYDVEQFAATGAGSGLFARTLIFLCLCLRLGEGKVPEERIKAFHVEADRNDPTRLKALTFLYEGEEEAYITPQMYSRWRPVLAAQNSLTIPDESANSELLEAEQDLNRAGAIALDPDFDSLLASMALVTGTPEKELLDWSVRRFKQRKAAADRLLNFLTCGIGEMSNFTTFKKGNPFPSWCYSRSEKSGALIDAETLMNGSAMAAIKNQATNQ